MTQHLLHRFDGFALLTRVGALLLFGALISIIGMRPSEAAPAPTAIVDQCRADLAKRLVVPVREVKVIKNEPTTWPDAALGLPEPGKAYAQVQTPGWVLVLQAKDVQYLYTAGKKAVRYGGPLFAWSASMLFVQSVLNEANLNGDLYQCSLLGTNPVKIISGVSAYYPQANGMILVTRRTSRSSYDLLLVKAGEGDKAKTLLSSFYIGAAALNEKGDAWAAISRPQVGGGWQVVVSRIGENIEKITLPLPDGMMPEQLAWSGEKLMLVISKPPVLPQLGSQLGCIETMPFADAPTWKTTVIEMFPGLPPFMLNKSETLEVTQEGTEEKPVVEVTRVWFTGDRTVKATIKGLTLRGYDLVGAGYVLVWGEQDGKQAAYTVNISTGEIIPTYCGSGRDIKPFEYPPLEGPHRLIME